MTVLFQRSYPGMAEDVTLRNKTRQILLEYFSLIPEEKSNSKDWSKPKTIETRENMEEIITPAPAVFNLPVIHEKRVGLDKETMDKKYHTEVISQDDINTLQKMLAAHTKNENGKIYVRSKSFESRKYHLTMQGKMQQLLGIGIGNKPVNEEENDSCNNNATQGGSDSKDEPVCSIDSRRNASCVPPCCKCKMRESRKRLQLNLPKNVIKCGDITDLMSANTYAVNLLEEISQDIMTSFPHNIFHEAVQELVLPLETKNEIPYELFSTVLKPMVSLQLTGTITNIWRNISVVMALIKETMIVGNFDEEMMEIMVDHSTKFFMENIVETVEEEGGWDVLNVRDCVDNAETGCPCRSSRRCEKNDCSETFRQVPGTLYNWLPVVVALATVGLGLAYTFR